MFVCVSLSNFSDAQQTLSEKNLIIWQWVRHFLDNLERKDFSVRCEYVSPKNTYSVLRKCAVHMGMTIRVPQDSCLLELLHPKCVKFVRSDTEINVFL